MHINFVWVVCRWTQTCTQFLMSPNWCSKNILTSSWSEKSLNDHFHKNIVCFIFWKFWSQKTTFTVVIPKIDSKKKNQKNKACPASNVDIQVQIFCSASHWGKNDAGYEKICFWVSYLSLIIYARICLFFRLYTEKTIFLRHFSKKKKNSLFFVSNHVSHPAQEYIKHQAPYKAW